MEILIMKNRHPASLLRYAVFSCFCMLFVVCQGQKPQLYEPTWESLQKHKVPQWFTDAKFGIFIHWGVYSVPAFHEWYLEFMSPGSYYGRKPLGPPYTAEQGSISDSMMKAELRGVRGEANRYHRENYGAGFEYDDFIPMFKAGNYDPAAWAALFRESGAGYVVMTARHGDEFALWPTRFAARNAMDMGPHRDLLGDLTKAVRAQGMKMGFYHNTTYTFWDKRYPGKEWVDYMNNSIRELVDLYQPDILWGDVVVGPYRDKNGKPLLADHWNSKEVISYFYNHSADPSQVLTNDRWDMDTSRAAMNSGRLMTKSLWADNAKYFNADGGLLGDFQTPERRNIKDIFEIPWETCDALDPSSWGYNKRTADETYMTTNQLVDYLADIVSKGGNLLINIGPKADGTIPGIMQDRLRGIGEWLKVNGEAIYGTRHWVKYGEGPTTGEVGAWNKKGYQFTAGDVRFTRKGNILYVILLEWPGKEIILSSLTGTAIRNITMLGSGEKAGWSKTDKGIRITLPEKPASPWANTLKIECRKL